MGTIDTIEVECPADGRELGAGQGRLLRKISAAFMWFGKAMLKRRTRMHLSELSNDLLDDIGVDPSAARREVKRFFWD
ncbi:DUF1127 domain-containing protein [Phyllobacterium endophyticum]|nr:DUF1127 domain-containing protein [Phyllobacterium endophyticum]MBB3234242.1 uncharacterized protein YjiS (DUF1127 family) [Phyllobacterium endophyticum]